MLHYQQTVSSGWVKRLCIHLKSIYLVTFDPNTSESRIAPGTLVSSITLKQKVESVTNCRHRHGKASHMCNMFHMSSFVKVNNANAWVNTQCFVAIGETFSGCNLDESVCSALHLQWTTSDASGPWCSLSLSISRLLLCLLQPFYFT